MQTKVVEPTQESLPVKKLQMPSDQNEDAIDTLESKNTKYLKKTVRGLGVRNKLFILHQVLTKTNYHAESNNSSFCSRDSDEHC